MTILKTISILTLSSVLTNSLFAKEAPYSEAIEVIKAVQNEGEGNEAAAAAWKQIIQGDATSVVPVLEAMNGSNGLASNWLISAAQTIVDRELTNGNALPLEQLGAFLMDTRQEARARRLAFELIQRVDPETAQKLVPGMINDPSNALRRDAVAGLLDEAEAMVEAEKKPAASIVYRQALGAARDIDQVESASKALQELGQKVDLPKHFGFLMHWSVVGPFDNTERKGFDTVFPPEEGVDLTGEYDGKAGKVSWSRLATSDNYGMVDVNKAYGPLKEVTAYAFTEYESPSDQPAQLRLGCKNAWKIWLNGELVFARDEYHRGIRIDQYQLPVNLQKGKNTLLVKLCQNEQEEDWTVQWQFQLRVCDATGTALLATNRLPTPISRQARARNES
ncbi:MAG: hypothetical protein L7V86_27715 [Verrucomicrobiales bacterium]|jgi:hypothetical protein|nr:hypothetical protein [Verrucomicrobiales bacterium]MDB2327137.1 hypothetical protein [bacterium]MDF1787181.1 hypothetical protein [Verrucomicrobiales bacterium]